MSNLSDLVAGPRRNTHPRSAVLVAVIAIVIPNVAVSPNTGGFWDLHLLHQRHPPCVPRVTVTRHDCIVDFAPRGASLHQAFDCRAHRLQCLGCAEAHADDSPPLAPERVGVRRIVRLARTAPLTHCEVDRTRSRGKGARQKNTLHDISPSPPSHAT